MQTSRSVQSLDNATFPYQPESCWSLLSAHCSPRPTYAVFTKKIPGQPLLAKVKLNDKMCSIRNISESEYLP